LRTTFLLVDITYIIGVKPTGVEVAARTPVLGGTRVFLQVRQAFRRT
jgi:hypothetical protein